MTTIKGKGFILRPVKVSDAKGILECYEDKKTKDNFMSALKDLESAEKSCKKKANEFRKKKPSDEKWIIEIDGKFAGWVELNALNERNFEHRAYLGYCVHPKFRGKGLATKAAKLLTKYALKKYKLKRLEAMCRDTNKASARILEKTGFKLEGILHKNKFKDGKYLNDMVWAIVK